MFFKRKRIMTWGLIGLGVIIAALGTTLVLTLPADGDGTWFGHGPWQGRWAFAAPDGRGDATEQTEADPRLLPASSADTDGCRWLIAHTRAHR